MACNIQTLIGKCLCVSVCLGIDPHLAIAHGWGRHKLNLNAEQLRICLIVRCANLVNQYYQSLITLMSQKASLRIPIDLQIGSGAQQSIHLTSLLTDHAPTILPDQYLWPFGRRRLIRICYSHCWHLSVYPRR
jgi:hypothetical protein